MSKRKFKVLRGLRDLLPEDVEKFNYVKSIIRDIFTLYGYKEIITPTLEEYTLFEVKAGEELRHRMYVFKDLGNRKVVLRPEITPSVARYYINHLLSQPKPIRLGYIANCFRYDEPQYGRYREFWQGGFELIGSPNPEADVEILSIADMLMRRLGFSNYYFKVSHIGILRGILASEKVPEKIQNQILGLFDKLRYDEAIKLLETTGVARKCIDDIKELINLKGQNAEKIIKDTEELVSKYPNSLKALLNLKSIIKIMDMAELKIPLNLDLGFARGLEYYTGIIFECFTSKMRLSLGGGGRYDNLIEIFGGPVTPAVGYAPGIDRIVLAIEEEGIALPINKGEGKVIVIPVSQNVNHYAIKVAHKFREMNIPVEIDVLGKGIKKMLSYASSHGFNYAVILGETELKEGKITIKNLKKEEQYTVTIEEAIDMIKSNVSRS